VTLAIAVLAGLFGASVGSFLNVVVYRLPRHESLSSPPSRCPSCGTAIAWRDNIPVLSWLLLRGRCRTCRTPISARYPLVEFATAVVFVAVALFGRGVV
jgi:leader peptidase (prepilin peptidase) / N-methyltransferase